MDKIKTSVRNLIEFVMRSGDIDNRFRTKATLREGQRIHQKLQKEYGLYFMSEVSLRHEETIKGILFEVEGRADGIYHQGEEVLIDEIKSTTRKLEEFTEKSHPLHWAQAMCYGYFYGKSHDIERVTIQLTYYQMDTEEIKKLQREFSMEVLGEFFRELLIKYLGFSKKIIAFRKLRDERIEVLPFPFPKYRQGQRKLAVGVYQSIKEGKEFLVEAPTGIGKTMSTLYPAIKAVGTRIDKIFYLTARSTTKDAARKALIQLMERGLRMKSVIITAKEKICLNDETKCNPEDCPFARGHFDRVNEAILDIYDKEDLLQKEVILDYSKKHKICPMEFQLDLAVYSDVVICDYNYVFDPQTYLRRFFESNVDPYAFLIDEAHNLPDRGRGMYSARISKKEIDEILEEDLEGPLLKPIINSLHYIREEILEEILKIKNGVFVSLDYKEDLLRSASITMNKMESFLSKEHDHPSYDKILNLYFSLNQFLKISEFYGKEFRSLAYVEEEEEIYEIKCLDPSRIFKDILTRAVSTIFFSATLSPMDFYGELFGAEDYYKLRLPSPFPEENLKIYQVPVSTRFIHREENYDKITQMLEAFTEEDGNYMLFFPSYGFMKEIFRRFRDDPGRRIQDSSMTEWERDLFLREFTKNSRIIAFVVLGGIFSEGIDLVGKRLENVAIVSVGLPGLGIETNLIREYYDEKKGKGFDYAFLYPGMNKVFQAAGRLIRSSEDKGKLLLVDDRYEKDQYKRNFPLHWKGIQQITSIDEIKEIHKVRQDK